MLVAYAKTNVRETNAVANTGLPRPEQVLIYNFAVSPEDVQQNSSLFAKLKRNLQHADQTAEEIQTGREVADALAMELVQKVRDMGLNPLRADRNMPINSARSWSQDISSRSTRGIPCAETLSGWAWANRPSIARSVCWRPCSPVYRRLPAFPPMRTAATCRAPR